MKFTKSLSLPFLSLALLLPMANVRAEVVNPTAPKAGSHVKEVAVNAASKAKELAGQAFESVKARASQFPSLAEIRSSVAQALRFENKGFKQVMADAQDAVVKSVKAHPFAAISAAATVAVVAGFLVNWAFGKRKKQLPKANDPLISEVQKEQQKRGIS